LRFSTSVSARTVRDTVGLQDNQPLNPNQVLRTEQMIRNLFKEVLNLEFGEFPHMTFEEAMRRYGSDKPDLRNPLELVDVEDQLKDVDFKVFSGPANDPKCRIAALRVPGAASMPRKQIDDYTKFVGIYGAKGLAYIKVNERAKGVEGLQSPIVKFLSRGLLDEMDAITAGSDPPDERRLIHLDQRIHRLVYRAARNPFLEAALDRYYVLALRLWFLALDRVAHLEAAVEEHRDLVQAIVDGDAVAAERQARDHVAGFERQIRQLL
jgi:hypothetical protein